MDTPRIMTLDISNFRSLLGDSSIDLGREGKNLFIYGENGSGKSSVCRALNIFFEATDLRKKTLQISNFVNRHVPRQDRGHTQICITLTNGERFLFNSNGHTGDLSFLQQSRRKKGFLEYKNLLPIYLYEGRNRNNLFRFFVEGPFANLRNPITKKQVSTEWVSDKKIKLPRSFYEGIFKIAEDLENEVNNLLKYFDENMQISFRTSKTWTTGELYIEVILDENYSVNNYGEYLNEARLVGVAISIYLAVILKYNDDHSLENKDGVNILIMDDVFIGMDMSNRLPLLKILQEKFVDYQIVMTTYDEHWFKLAKFYLENSSWKFIRVYTQKLDSLVSRSKFQDDERDNYTDKAIHYFNQNDYPACANYQRKAIEEHLKRILPDNLLRNTSEDGATNYNDKLSTNFNNFIKYLSDSGLNPEIFSEFSLYSKMILNPLSHDNNGSPVFKREVEAVFNILSNLSNVETILLKKITIDTNSTLLLALQDPDQNWHNYKFQIYDNLKRITQGNNIGYAPCRFKPVKYKKNKEEWVEIDENAMEMRELYKSLCHKHGVKGKDYAQEYKNNSNVSISQMQRTM